MTEPTQVWIVKHREYHYAVGVHADEASAHEDLSARRPGDYIIERWVVQRSTPTPKAEAPE